MCFAQTKVEKKSKKKFHCLMFLYFRFIGAVYEKLEETLKEWKRNYYLFILIVTIYVLILSPVTLTYWVKVIWFRKYWNDFTKMYINSTPLFIGTWLCLFSCFTSDFLYVDVSG